MAEQKGISPEQDTEGDEFSAAGLSVEDEIRAAEELKNTSPKRFRESFAPGPVRVDGLETAETGASYMDRFERFIGDLGLRHFEPHEFLMMGGSNRPGGSCAGRNALPPDHLWQNLAPSARMIDEIRARLGTSVIIFSAYRSENYNACIEGAPRSQHKRFCALDLAARGGSVADWWRVAREVRDSIPDFAGGIGRYDSFVHIDTRGQTVDW